MKFKFKFIKTKYENHDLNIITGLYPVCFSIFETQQEKNVGYSLGELMDDYERIINNLEQGIDDISTENWILDMMGEKVFFEFIYSSKGSRKGQAEISRKSLIKLMKKWHNFKQREPDLDYEEVIELPDEENPTVYSEAFFGTFETFLEKYKGNYKNDLLFTAFFNIDMGEKCKIINFLINQGFSIDEFKDENLFIFLFDGVIRGKEDVEALLEISKFLLGKKVDISRIEKHTQKTIFSNLLKIFPKNEKILIPLYDLIFSQSHLKLLHKDVNGFTPLELAKKRKRNIVLKYMEDYVEKYDLKDSDVVVN